MINIVKKTFKQSWKSFAVYAFVIFWYGLLIVAIYPSMQKTMGNVSDFYSQMPKEFLDAFGGIDTMMNSFDSYIALEYLSIMWPLMMIAMIVAFVTRHVTKEIETGTMELLLSQPVSRTKVFISKMVVIVSEVIGMVAVTIGSLSAFAAIFNIEFSGKGMIFLGLSAIPFYLAVVGITFLFSAMFKDRGRALAASIGVIIGMYAINIIANIKKSLKDIDYVTLWHYYRPQEVLKNASLNWFPDVTVLLLVGAATFIVGWLIFRRKDI